MGPQGGGGQTLCSIDVKSRHRSCTEAVGEKLCSKRVSYRVVAEKSDRENTRKGKGSGG